MSGSDWNELERAWQSLPASVTPAVEELKRARRWAWWSWTYFIGEIIVTVAAVAVAVWLAQRDDTLWLVMALATLVFTAVASGTSFAARWVARERFDDPVMQTVSVAIRRVEIGLRLARATLWSICGALGYVAVFAGAVHLWGEPGEQAKGYIAVALALVWLAVVLAGTIVYLQRRTADLVRLKAIEASLNGEV